MTMPHNVIDQMARNISNIPSIIMNEDLPDGKQGKTYFYENCAEPFVEGVFDKANKMPDQVKIRRANGQELFTVNFDADGKLALFTTFGEDGKPQHVFDPKAPVAKPSQ